MGRGREGLRREGAVTLQQADETLLTVNGQERRIAGDARMPLLNALRGTLGLSGVRFGCGAGLCGACNVLIDGRAVASCNIQLGDVAGRAVVTAEGLGTPAAPHPLQRALLAEQAAQCGYCIPGILISAAALLARTPRPTETEVRAALDGNLCRCGSHNRIVRAVLRAAGEGAPL
jgi:nicotinate dehydrogenase subunit A